MRIHVDVNEKAFLDGYKKELIQTFKEAKGQSFSETYLTSLYRLTVREVQSINRDLGYDENDGIDFTI